MKAKLWPQSAPALSAVGRHEFNIISLAVRILKHAGCNAQPPPTLVSTGKRGRVRRELKRAEPRWARHHGCQGQISRESGELKREKEKKRGKKRAQKFVGQKITARYVGGERGAETIAGMVARNIFPR